jgi:ABC-type Na+ efflux pump permease subunit
MNKHRLRDSKILSILVVALTVIAAGLTFMFKLYEFVAASTTGVLPGIVTATVLPYFFISGGFLLLAGWAWAGGHYKDIEGPKQAMLQQEAEYERMERQNKLFYE